MKANTRYNILFLLLFTVIAMFVHIGTGSQAMNDNAKTNLPVAVKEEAIIPATTPSFEENAIVIVATTHLTGVTTGNGFVFGDGTLVATAYHLIADVSKEGDHVMLGAPTVISRYLGNMYEAKIVKIDPDADFAILRLGWDRHPALELATGQELLNANEITVAGYPGIKEMDLQNTTQICSERLFIDEISVQKEEPRTILLSSTEKIGSGWSGAPIILSENGKVAGLFSALHSHGNQKWQPWGCSANAINALVGKTKEIQNLHTQEKLKGIPPEHSEEAFIAAVTSISSLLQRNYKDAVSNAQKFVKLRPDSPKAHTMLAAALSKSGDNNLAEEQYKKALKLAPDSSAVHFSYGIFLQQSGRKEEALAECRRALEIEPEDVSIMLNLLNLLEDSGKNEEAEILGRHAVEANPKNAYLWNNLSNILGKREKMGESIQALTTAVTLKPEMGPLRGNLAFKLEKAGRLDEAENHYKELLKIEPTNSVVWFWYARFLSKHRPEQQDEALEAVEKAISLNSFQRVPSDDLRQLQSQLESLIK